MKIIRLKNEGVSEIVGTVILLAIAVVAFSAFAIYVFSYNNPSPSPNLNLVGYVDNGNVIIEHKGGEGLKLENIKIIVYKGEMDSFCCFFDENGMPTENHVHLIGNGNNRWEVGEYVSINATAIFGDISNWQISIIVIDEDSNSVIMTGILQEGLTMLSPPIAIFTYAPIDPKTLEIIVFNASQSYDPDGGKIVIYKWDFGDGNIGYGKVVVHKYSSPGIYNVTLTITDDEGQKGNATTGAGIPGTPPPVNVTDNIPPQGDFEWYVNPNIDGTIDFYANVTDPDGEIISYFWNFGDGGTSSSPNPSNTYEHSGNYTVTLIVTDDNGGQTVFTKTITVPNILPIAGFSYSPRNITTVLTVTFDGGEPYSYDKDGYIVAWHWDFGDGGTADGETVTHKFTDPGNYTVTLTVTDNDGGESNVSKILRVYPKPAATPPTFLIVDNTPIGWESGIDNIILACQNIMPESEFYYAKAIDDWYFTNDEYTSPELRGQRIDDALINQFDIVIWSCGDFPGDGGPANYEPWLSHPNYWSTSMTEGEYWNDSSGGDDNANHVYELAQHLTGNITAGTLLLCGTYVVRDLQNYPGNGVSSSEVWLGDVLGLIEPSGGIDYDWHYEPFSGRLGSAYFRGRPYTAAGILYGIANTSSGQIGVANLEITSPIKLYALHKKSDDLFQYSLVAGTSDWEIILDEDMEINPGWSHGGNQDEWEWGTPTYGPSYAHSGSKLYGTDLDYKYNNNANCWLKTPEIDLSEYINVQLEFWHWYRLEYGWDYVYLEITDDGGASWHRLASYTGSRNWRHQSFDISSYAGKTVQIRWRLVSDYSVIKAGYYLDDVLIKGKASTIPSGYYAIDAGRGKNRSIILGFDLNADEITQESRTNYLRNVLAWLAIGAGYVTEIWVDNMASEEWLNQPNHFATINDAINAICPGGKIYVMGDKGQIYNEDVLINKSIDLIGIDNPKIIGNNYGIKVTVDWVKIEGFTIENSKQGIYIDNSARTTIINCTIQNVQKEAIYLIYSHNNTIKNNNIQNNLYGIYATGSLGNKIRYNVFDKNGESIHLYRSSLNIIERNSITDSNIGIYIDSAEENTISNNLILNCDEEAIYLVSSTNRNSIVNNTINESRIGIKLEISNTNTILNNSISNSLYGIKLIYYSHTNTIRENVIILSNVSAISVENSSDNCFLFNNISKNGYGIYLYSSSGNILQLNNISDNSQEAIYLASSSNNNIMAFNNILNNSLAISIYNSNGNVMKHNYIVYNKRGGIYLSLSMPTINGENEIINNNISFNNGTAIYLYRSGGNTIANNTIISNSHGIKIEYLSNLNEIRNNSIINNSYGIYIERGNYNILLKNNITNNELEGILILSYSSENILMNNTIKQNKDGIGLQSSSTNTIENNTICENGYGLIFLESHSNIINSNTIFSNSLDGIQFTSSDENKILNNEIYNNLNGIHLISSGGTGNIISNNTIYSNRLNGIYLENSRTATAGNNDIIENKIYNNNISAILLQSSNINSIRLNHLHSNKNGIYFNSSNSNTICGNIVFNNSRDGIYLHLSNNNDIENNSIFSNNRSGLYLLQSSQGDSLPIKNNMIWNNTYGIFINSSDNNYIMHNILWNNSYGICMIYSSTNNEVYENNITTNNYGVYVASSDCTANKFYYNNFINNTLHNDSQAYDMGNNSWYISTSGNYWSEHTTTDPYIIPPGINQDKYPLLSPRKWWL